MWIDALKQHVMDEIAYSPTHKALYVGLIDEATKNPDPETALSALVKSINSAGTMRSRELAKFVGRVLYQYREESKKLPTDAQAAKMVLLNNIILQRKE